MFNTVTLQGNTGKAFALKQNVKGTDYAIGSFCSMLNAVLDTKTGEWTSEGLWLGLRANGYLARKAARIPKGSRIVVSGKLRNYISEESEVEENQAGYLYIDVSSIEIIGDIPDAEEKPAKTKKPGAGKKPVAPPEPEEETEGAL